MKSSILIIMLFLCVSVFSQHSIWTVDEGWVKRKISNSESDKFFAIALWGIPEYKYTPNNREDSPETYRNNKYIFKKYTDMFNMVYFHSGYSKNYMSDKIIVSGSSEFPWYFERYMNNFNNTMDSNTTWINMHILEKHTHSKFLTKEINNAIDLVISSHKKNGLNEYIWAPIDEVSSWPPVLIESIYDQIKQKDNNKLIYIDLTGNGKVRSFKNKHKEPIQANYSDSSFDDNWFQNIKQIAYEYRKGGDVFGINSYSDFYNKPRLAGNTVDAIKAGVGENTPVWLWFDSSSYAKPKDVKQKDYLNNIRCQIFTSIIHGASGVMFWTDTKKKPEVFNSLLPIVKEVQNIIPLIKSKTIEKKSSGDLHYIVKEFNNKKMAIIVNTDKDNPIYITYPITKYLLPLEVYVGEF